MFVYILVFWFNIAFFYLFKKSEDFTKLFFDYYKPPGLSEISSILFFKFLHFLHEYDFSDSLFLLAVMLYFN